MNIGIDVTYAQSRDSELINWLEFLEKPNKTALEIVASRDLSVRWQTTAVADVSVYLPRSSCKQLHIPTGAPLDKSLQYLNNEFAKAVWMKDYKQALTLYREIQKEGLIQTINFLKDE